MNRERREGVVGADPHEGRDQVDDVEREERDAGSADAELLLTDAALRPDDPVEGEAARRGADPDLGIEPERGGEEP